LHSFHIERVIPAGPVPERSGSGVAPMTSL
jgi:hypothetical protein